MPDDWAELKTNQSVKDLPSLLRLNQIHVHGSRILNCIGYGIFSDLMKDNSLSRFNRKIQHLAQMPSNSLSFAVFIGCEPDVFLADCLDISLKFGDNFLFFRINFIDCEKIVSHVNRWRSILRLFNNRANMPHAGQDVKILAEVFLDGFSFGW